ncbi:MAG: hypothetical protein RL150_300 [Candidatus Parcubacteria bacterium]|jgi:hypothetical protein
MKWKPIVAALFIVVAGLFLFLAKPTGQQTNAVVTNAVSFICEDGTYFVAEFMSDTTMRVVVDGVLARTVSKEDVPRTQYDDDRYSYLFAGERVTVADKEQRTMTSCGQPFDPNNAPYNFGDDQLTQ